MVALLTLEWTPHLAHKSVPDGIHTETLSRAGFFLCSANVRLDKFSGDTARLLVGINDDKDANAGLSVVQGSGRSHS